MPAPTGRTRRTWSGQAARLDAIGEGFGLVTLSYWLFAAAFFCYVGATVLYAAGYLGRGRAAAQAAAPAPAGAVTAGGTTAVAAAGGPWYQRAPRRAYALVVTGTLAQALAIACRGLGAGHWPTANMFEFLGFFGFTTMLAFLVMDRLLPVRALGAVVAPLGVVLLGYAALFPAAPQPLIPALQSHWLYLHVSTAALGEGFFAVAFVAALLYLLRTREQGESRLGAFALESVFWMIITIVTFILLAFVLRRTGHQWEFLTHTGRTVYHLPPLIGPGTARVGEAGSLLGIPLPLILAPAWLKAKHANTFLFAVPLGTLVYALIRGLCRRPVAAALAPLTRGMNPALLDEVSYRAVAIGYPIFTLGGLVFAMLWARKAWGRYWFWDPKETWAFIAFMVYTIYLHMRIVMGWGGRRSAWLAVVGFGVILFTLVGVNLLIVGLHSYAGGD